MSLAELKQELERVKNLVTQVEKLLESSKSIVEASAAKVIQDLTAEMQKCPCNKEILEAIKAQKPEQPPKDQVVSKDDNQEDQKPSLQSLRKYSFPNWNVGNAELGSSGNPNAIRFPPQ